MQKLLTIFFITALFITGCKKDTKFYSKKIKDTTTVVFEKHFIKFDTIVQGEKLEFEFKFKNIGHTPYLIEKVYTSCGCTVAYYPSKPISPGDSGRIKVVFNSEGKIGEQFKRITVIGNTKPSEKKLFLKGFVKLE